MIIPHTALQDCLAYASDIEELADGNYRSDGNDVVTYSDKHIIEKDGYRIDICRFQSFKSPFRTTSI